MPDLPAWVAADKSLGVSPIWSGPDQGDGHMVFVVAVAIRDSVVEGPMLRGGCYVHRPEDAMMFQLEYAPLAGRRRLPLARLDWRPANPGHKNPRTGAAPHAGRFIESSHLHPFELNWLGAEGRMRAGNLPFAVPMSPDPRTFRELLDFAGSAFRLSGMDLIEPPKWPSRLV